MEISLQRTESTYLKLILGSLGAFVLFIALCWGGFRSYQNWQERHLIRHAAAVLSGGDIKTASLNARRVLQLNPENADAMRLMAEISEKMGERNAMDWRRKVLHTRGHSMDDALALAQSALRAKDYGTAATTLENLGAAAEEKPEFQAASAQLATARKDLPAAEAHWAKAAELAPQNSGHRLQLALVRLGLADPVKRESAVKALEELRSDPTQRTFATRALVLEGIAQRRDSQRVVALGKELQAYSDALVTDRILYLDLLRQTFDPAYGDYLFQLKTEAPAKPTDLATLLSWMIRNRMTTDAIEFADSLPAERTSKWPVPLAIAEAFVQVRDWLGLEALAGSDHWSGYDFLRHAYLARALRGQEKTLAAEQELSAAQKEAATNPQMLSMLTRTVADWGWQNETVELLWALAKNSETRTTALRTLYEHFMKVRDTAGLYRALARLAEVDPDDAAIQNNLAQISLLLGVDTEHATKAAEQLTSNHPSNATYASTYAFSFLSKGDSQGALEIMNRLNPDQLRDPSVATYYGLVLAAAGQKERAREFLARSSEAMLLPEEQALVAKAESAAD